MGKISRLRLKKTIGKKVDRPSGVNRQELAVLFGVSEVSGKLTAGRENVGGGRKKVSLVKGKKKG